MHQDVEVIQVRGGMVMAIKKKHTKHSKYKKQSGTVVNARPVKTFTMPAEQMMIARLGGIISMSPPPCLFVPKVPK